MLLNDKKVFVGSFLTRNQRTDVYGGANKKFTNVFVKNLAETVEEPELRAMFEKYGEITSCVVAMGEEGKSKGHGFVNFKDATSAENACDELNESEINGKKLFVGRFQKKIERVNTLKKIHEEKKQERHNRYIGINLYIKNLDDTIDDDRLRKEFASFGTITSAKIMQENGRSKGFGFVCFSAPEEATKAVTDMNGRIVGTKPLYVALAQRKEDRKNHLASQYMQRITTTRMQNQQQMSQVFANAAGGPAGIYLPNMPSAATRFYPSGAGFGAPVRPTPRWAGGQSRAPAPGNSYQNYQMVSGGGPRGGARMPYNPAQAGMIRSGAPGARMQFNNMRMPSGGAPSSVVNGGGQFARPQMPKYRAAAPAMPAGASPAGGAAANATQAINVPGQEPLTTGMLASAQPQEQKQMLGERLYPLIHSMHPEWAGKITGMLLEIDNAELLHMLDSRESLKAKVDEAVVVLQAHQAKQVTAQRQAEQ
jgi:polyadenylate-binding protein